MQLCVSGPKFCITMQTWESSGAKLTGKKSFQVFLKITSIETEQNNSEVSLFKLLFPQKFHNYQMTTKKVLEMKGMV